MNMKFFILLICTLSFYNVLGQDYRSKTKQKIDSVWRCCSADSVIRILENRNYNKKKIVKDQIVISILDSLLAFNNSNLTLKDLKDIFKNKAVVNTLTDRFDSTYFNFNGGGYLRFALSCRFQYDQKKHNCNLSIAPYNGKIKVICNLKPKCDEKDHFINYLYYFKYIEPTIMFNKLLDGGEHMYIEKKGVNWHCIR